MSGSSLTMTDAVTYMVEEKPYDQKEVFAILEQMAINGAVCLYESPRKAQCMLASNVPYEPEERALWWEECTSCTISHADAELRLEKAPFTQEAIGRLLQDVPQQEQGRATANCVYTAFVRQTAYVLRRHSAVTCIGKLAYKEYFGPNSDGMLQCNHTRTAGMVRE